MTRISILIAMVTVCVVPIAEPAASTPLAQGKTFPVVGATYQLDRARYPGKLAICATEAAMAKYMEAKDKGNQAAADRMLIVVSTASDLAKLEKTKTCTLISSYSQATIVAKGVESHKATFAAFPGPPMWGYYLYFGGLVR